MQHAGGVERGGAVPGRHRALRGVRLPHAGVRRAAAGAGGVPPQLRLVLLGPDKEASALYLFLGWYPLLQPKLEAIRRPLLRWLAKLAVAAVSTGVMYALLLYVFCLEAVVEEFAQTAPWLLWLTAVLGLLVFVVYDILLRRFTVMWRRKKRKA